MTIGEIFTALAYVVGAAVFFWAAKKRNLATSGIAMLVGIGFVAGTIGAKLTEFIYMGWPVKIPFLAVTQPELGGRALGGGILVGWLGVEIAKRVMGIKRSTGDMFALALPAGEIFGRIGCYFNGCCYGTPTSLPWAVWQHGAWRHPAQLYSSFVAVLTLGFLLWVAPKLKREGQLFMVYLLIFGVTRFGLEFLRYRDSVVLGLSPMQWLCLDLAVAGFFMLRRRDRLEVQELRHGI